MYKSVYDSWSQADKKRIIDDNESLSSKVDELRIELYNANLKLEELNSQKESLNKQRESLNQQREQLKNQLKDIYKTVKFSEDANIALDAYVNYKHDCETQLKELNDHFSKHKQNIDEQFRKYRSNIYTQCRNIILLISLVLTCLFGSITLYLYSSNADYIEDISTISSKIEKLNKDNKRLQSDYDEASSTISNYKSELNSFKTKYNECESTLKSSAINKNLKNSRK